MGEVVPFKMSDSLSSVVAGMGDPLRDKLAASSYGMQFVDDAQLLNIYRSNWLGKKIVDIPAMDAVRKGRDWQASKEQIELIEAEQNRLGFWNKLLEVKTKARLWGGAALYIGTGETDLIQPLDPERVTKGGIKYLTPLTRRDLMAGPIDQDVMSEFHGRPAYYDVTGATAMVRVHPSRFAVFVGAPHADSVMASGLNQGWGDSILESVYSAMRNADATAANIASLVFEANVDVFRMPNFMSQLSDPGYAKKVIERFSLAATSKGINRALIMDKDEEYERKTVSFATLPEVMQTFLQIVAGAADIPVTRLLGQSPSGMSSTGTSDMKNYHDRVASIQTLELTPALYRLDECLIRSALGSRPPEIYYSWSPLEQMSEKELAEIGKMNAETAQVLTSSGLFMANELRTVVGNQLIESGFYPGLDQVMAETGEGFDPDLGKDGEDDEVDDVVPPKVTADAAPRTLYIRRDVLNAAEIVEWAKGQGFDTVQDGLHVTIMHTRSMLDWIKVGQAGEWSSEDDGHITIAPGGPRLMEKFGEAVVLQFASTRLAWRHEDIKSMGAETDYPDYQPHITISWDAAGVDLSKVEPYKGKIVLGPEQFEEVNDDWKAGIKEG
ncbi:anti-CBASS protein Acb1 family protein [Pararhizobium sp.]|uniref:anti-CBASS protein Acb1 family protein n=1 Tax=Pararhizobium sp. TaxID=1977563 RepID=UPI00271F9B51|nr:anti-CBASS Acb1 family protein [Pararhizobium sp.]MDO9417022.1 DUF1073 domain-containing protein [Pararhizobium sp.]